MEKILKNAFTSKKAQKTYLNEFNLANYLFKLFD